MVPTGNRLRYPLQEKPLNCHMHLRHLSVPIYGVEQEQKQGSPRGVCFLPVSLKMVQNSSALEPHAGTMVKGDKGSVSRSRDLAATFGHSQHTQENDGDHIAPRLYLTDAPSFPPRGFCCHPNLPSIPSHTH